MNAFLFSATFTKMTLISTIIANFTVCWLTTPIMCSRTEFAFHDDFKIWISFPGSVRFSKFINLVDFRILCKVPSKFKRVFLVSSYACPSFRAESSVKSGSRSRRSLKWLSVIPILISLISEFCKAENSHSLLSFFSSVTKLSKHCPSDCLYEKNLYRRKVTFFEGSNNHQIVVKYNWFSFSWSHHQIQTYYILPFLSVQCRSIACWIWLLLISWFFLWQWGTGSVVSIVSGAHCCFCWNWALVEGWIWCFRWNGALVEGWIYPYQTDYHY